MVAGMVGQHLAHYRIDSKLGQGGMGVVYRAHDEKLERDVALKVLPPGALSDEAARKRFRQEALALSQLNHPHICTIYEVGECDGQSYIAMEHIPGAPLSALIAAHGLPSDSVIRYAIQIADALAHAHGRGILHRDLKAANVMVTPEGRIKVLDFGLAKIIGGDRPSGISEAATVSAGLTEKGTIVGTFQYMAPEVLRGEPADFRSDIWALGILLYVAVEGKLPFHGKSLFELTAAVLKESPPPLPAQTPAGLRAIILRCLAKEPAQRYQSADQIRSALEVIHDISLATAGAAPHLTGPRPARRWMPAVALAILTVAAGTLLWQRQQVPSYHLSGQRLISTFPGSHRQASFSPDSSMIAFLNESEGVPQVWIKNLAQGDPIQITFGANAASRPRWSPRNDQIVFGRRGQGIWSVPPLGGQPRRITEGGRNPGLSADGEWMVFEIGNEIWVSKADGTGARRLEGVPEKYYGADGLPAFSPDGQWIALFHPNFGPNGDLWVVPARGGKAKQLSFDNCPGGAPVWMPDGRSILYSSTRDGSRTLWRVPLAGGAPIAVTTGAGEDHDPALSADGKRMIYTNVRSTQNIMLLDPSTGTPKEILESRAATVCPRFSPDGERFAFFRQTGADAHLFVASIDGKNLTQVTRAKGERNIMPVWSGDGAFLFFYQVQPAQSYRKVPVAVGPSIEVAPWVWEIQNEGQVDPAGKHVVYTLQEHGERKASLVRDLATGQERALALPMSGLHWSRDGETVLGVSGADIAACPASGGACTILARGYQPRWSADASRIFFLRSGGNRLKPELWRMDVRSRKEQRIGFLGPFQPMDVHFDVSKTDQVIWVQYREGRHELWMGEL